MNITTFKEN